MVQVPFKKKKNNYCTNKTATQTSGRDQKMPTTQTTCVHRREKILERGPRARIVSQDFRRFAPRKSDEAGETPALHWFCCGWDAKHSILERGHLARIVSQNFRRSAPRKNNEAGETPALHWFCCGRDAKHSILERGHPARIVPQILRIIISLRPANNPEKKRYVNQFR
jgi:hypothetical protein